MKDKNNNLTLLILLIGVVVLVLYCKKSYKEENYTNFVDNQTLININNKLVDEKGEFEKARNKINLLKANKGHNITVDGTSIPASLDLNEMVLLNNSIKHSVGKYDNQNNVYNIQQKIQNKQIASLGEELGKLNVSNNDDKPITYIKNPYMGVSLKVSEVKNTEGGGEQQKDKKYLVHINNDCLTYDRNKKMGDDGVVDNYGLSQCNELDPQQYMSLDYFKLGIGNISDSCKDKHNECNDEGEAFDGNSPNPLSLDSSSYITYYNKFINDKNSHHKLNEVTNKYKPDQLVVIQPHYTSDSPELRTQNCLSINNKNISLEDCKLGKSQTWMPGHNKLSC